MVEFIHTSDWHLGNPFSTFSDAEAAALASARFEAVSRLFAYARGAGVRLLLCAGDQIDNGELRDATILLRLFGIIAGYPEVQVVMIAGNHDPLTPGSIYRRVDPASYPRNLLFVPAPQAIALPAFGARLLAAPLAARSGRVNPILELAAGLGKGAEAPAGRTENAAGTESRPGEGAAGAPVTIGLAHGSLALSESLGAGDDAFPIASDFAERVGLDYLALGDWHSFLKAGPRTYYPGTHEPLAFGDDAGALHVRIGGPGDPPEVRRIGESSFRWREVRRSVDEETVELLFDELAGAARGGERTLVRLVLDGYLGLARFKQLEERIAIAEAQLFGLFADRLPTLRPGQEEIRALVSEGYLGRVVDRLIERAASGEAAAEEALLVVHEFFRAKSEGPR